MLETIIEGSLSMREFPVRITKESDGLFSASLIDVADGPRGRGNDEESALRALTEPALEILRDMREKNTLPVPSETDGLPTIALSDIEHSDAAASIGETDTIMAQVIRGQGNQATQITYSWTNDLVFHDK